ncbi:PstS family phosphate ABC transporter substrate-binding protein [Egbenema bharatensis]|uniref:PstS family phosphate ABC transporter substrate-binding protein n=1 Tax=Egbenema bharatensis TaxID=3463334 RepID=UPI003A85E23E
MSTIKKSIHPSASFSAALLTTALLVSACSTPQVQTTTSQVQLPAAITNDIIEIDGSSTVYPITEAAVQQYQQRDPDVQVTAAFSGTGGGFRKFCAGETDITGASRPISTQELAACRDSEIRFVELPIAFDALTVVVHPGNDWVDSLTVDELKSIWSATAQGQVTNWNQIRPDFPDRPLTLYGPGADSGTYDYFAEAIVGENRTRSDFTGSEDDDILVRGVANDPNALGYFGLSYYEQNQDQLKALAIDSGNGPVLPDRENVETASYQPLSRPLFVYVNIQSAQHNEHVREFMDFYLQNAIDLIESVGYIPLPEDTYEIGYRRLYQGKVGTVYDGKPEPALTIQEVLLREEKF